MKTHDALPGTHGFLPHGGGSSGALAAPMVLLLAGSAVACSEGDVRASGTKEAPLRSVVTGPGPAPRRIWPPAAKRPWGQDAPLPRPAIRGVVFTADMQVYEARPGEPLAITRTRRARWRFLLVDSSLSGS